MSKMKSKSEMIPTLHMGKWVQFRIEVDGQSEMYNIPITLIMRSWMGPVSIQDWCAKWVTFKVAAHDMTARQKINAPEITAGSNYWCSIDEFLSEWFPKHTEKTIIRELEAEFMADLENEKIAAEKVKQDENRALNIAEDMSGQDL